MDVSLIVAGAAIGGNVLIGVGLAFTIVKNGKSAAGIAGEFRNEVSNLKEAVTDLTGVVTTMDAKVDKYQLETVDRISGHEAKIESNEKSIEVIFGTMERRKTH